MNRTLVLAALVVPTAAADATRWENFPNRGVGTYKATWSQGGVRLGPSLRFTQR